MMSARDFVFKTFTDPKGIPDAKLLTAFAMTFAMFPWLAYCTFTKHYPPDGIFLTYMGTLTACLGLAHRENNTSITMDTQKELAAKGNPENIYTTVNNPE
jgi:protein-S-isoprenylcysteine O-methyltransferase Ste14